MTWIKLILGWVAGIAVFGGVGVFGLLMMGFASDGITQVDRADRAFFLFTALGGLLGLGSFAIPILLSKGAGFWKVFGVYSGLCALWPMTGIAMMIWIASRP